MEKVGNYLLVNKVKPKRLPSSIKLEETQISPTIYFSIKWRTTAHSIQITYNYSSYAMVDRRGENNRIRTKNKKLTLTQITRENDPLK